jgi:hypothetical protein
MQEVVHNVLSHTMLLSWVMLLCVCGCTQGTSHCAGAGAPAGDG